MKNATVALPIDVIGNTDTSTRIALLDATAQTKVEQWLNDENVKFTTKRLAKTAPASMRRSDIEPGFFDQFQRIGSINAMLKDIVAANPKSVELLSLGQTAQGRDLNLVRIASLLSEKPKVFFVQAGLHAREWAAPSSLLYFIKTLTDNLQQLQPLLDDVEVHLVPVANPDGYEFSHTDVRCEVDGGQFSF